MVHHHPRRDVGIPRAGPRSRARVATLGLVGLAMIACASGGDADGAAASAVAPQEAFWASLRNLCGSAFAGTIVESVPPDTSLSGKDLVMHVRECNADEIRVPFFVGDDRSRTWVITRTGQGLRLKHDHRHEDGSEDEITQYGGDTASEGRPDRQEFPADAHTASIVAAAATNVWTIEIRPERTFAYALRREGADRRFRVEFDLTSPIPEPPPPWGTGGSAR